MKCDERERSKACDLQRAALDQQSGVAMLTSARMPAFRCAGHRAIAFAPSGT
jgi:hypothetical protein